MLQSINPATGELIKGYKELSSEQLKQQLEKSEKAFQYWKQTSFSERAKLMKKAAMLLRDFKSKYGKLMAEEMGKPISQAEAESEKCAWVCDYFADNAEKFLQDEIIQTEAKKSYVRFEPLGAILAVMPWNFPFWQVFRFAAPALMAGNTAVLKHSSNVMGCALEIENIFLKAGFPENVFKTLLISSNMVEKVIKNPIVKAVTLTGSDITGSKVSETAGREIKKTVMELGGNDPSIILKDADIGLCASKAADARLINSGQSCIAAKRFIVVNEIADEFEKLYQKEMENKIIGDPFDRKTQLGPLAREDLLIALDNQVKQSVKLGAKLLTGGCRIKRKGFYYAPTLLTDVKKGMPAYGEETFGPVASIIRVKDEKEAVKIANDSKYGLGAAVWTKDLKKGELLANQIEAGNVFVNGIVHSDPRLPFGGIKRSGYGRELSHYGIKEFVNIKAVKVF